MLSFQAEIEVKISDRLIQGKQQFVLNILTLVRSLITFVDSTTKLTIFACLISAEINNLDGLFALWDNASN